MSKINDILEARKAKVAERKLLSESLASMDGVALLCGERQPGESNRAILACNDYLRMGPARSVANLLRRYKQEKLQARVSNIASHSTHTIYNWSAQFEWEKRAEMYDGSQDAERGRYAQEVMSTGLAVAHNRIAKLKELALQLEEAIQTKECVWMLDVKSIGSGRWAERVDLVKFNWNLIEQYRGVMDDLARETGGRANVNKLMNEKGGLIRVSVGIEDDEDEDGELKTEKQKSVLAEDK